MSKIKTPYDKKVETLLRSGDLLSELGIFRCAMLLHAPHHLAKEEYVNIIRQNYHTSLLSPEQYHQIDTLWSNMEKYFGSMLISYTNTTLTLRDPMDDFFDFDDEHSISSQRHRLYNLKDEMAQLIIKKTFVENQLNTINAEIQSITDQCTALGHLHGFDQSDECKICGKKIVGENYERNSK